jgi:hypothetical protein
MRRWAPLLFALVSSLLLATAGCAFTQTPNRQADPPQDGGAGDDAWWTAAAPSGSGLPNGEGGPPVAPYGVDASVDAPTSTDDASADADETGGPPARAPSFPPFDPGEGGICSGALAPGDLVIDEMMIESVAGSGDHGEWLEAQSTVDCAIDIRGLHGDAPSGAKVRRFDINDDLWVPAFGRFVVADSTIAAINHDLPGAVVSWFGQPGDVLRNKGGTVTLHMNGLVIDSVTYPSMTLTVGASLSFPSDCPLSRRADWGAWQTSNASWFPGFYGTPNAPNTDVQCP